MPKVYETSSGKKPSNFTLYPSWKCPRCAHFVRQPIARVCRDCKKEEGPDIPHVPSKV